MIMKPYLYLLSNYLGGGGGGLTGGEETFCKDGHCCPNMSYIKKWEILLNVLLLYLIVVNEHSVYFFIFAANVLCTARPFFF
jgi:hypothetical protein